MNIKEFNWYCNCELTAKIIADFDAHTVDVTNFKDDSYYLPFSPEIKPTWEQWQAVLKSHCPSEHNAFIQDTLKELGLDHYDILEIIKKTKGAMGHTNCTVELVNDDMPASDNRIYFWRGNQGKFCLSEKFYKADEYGYEAASEYLTSEILRHSNCIDYVTYEMVPNFYQHHNVARHCCDSALFFDRYPQGNEITLAEFLQTHSSPFDLRELTDPNSKFRARHALSETISTLVDLIVNDTGLVDFGGYLTAVMELDALTRNDDRHYNNLSLIQFPNGLWKIAPIFDNGSGFGARDKDPASGGVYGTQGPWLFNEARYYKIGARPFSSSFEKQVKACRSLYGPRLQIQKDINLRPAFERIAAVYGKPVADRMESVWTLSLKKHEDMFVQKITRPAYSSEQGLGRGL